MYTRRSYRDILAIHTYMRNKRGKHIVLSIAREARRFLIPSLTYERRKTTQIWYMSTVEVGVILIIHRRAGASTSRMYRIDFGFFALIL